MSKPLETRLRDAKKVLDRVDHMLGKHPAALKDDVKQSLQKMAECRDDINDWIELVKARTSARQLLDGLETRADEDDCVPFSGAGPVKYQHARMIGVQSYVTLTWALADSITGMVGRILCTPSVGRNIEIPVQLVSHFLKRDNKKKGTAAVIFESVQRSFGWPIGLSYAIRNHFVHEGAQRKGSNFFDGPSAASAFRISDVGWNTVENTARVDYGLDPKDHRVGALWPDSPRDDLRKVLIVCERETDDALGILLGSACHSLQAHVGFMVGED